MQKHVLAAAFVLAALVPLSGCGAAKVKITGTLKQSGHALLAPRETIVTITFIPDAEGVNLQSQIARYHRNTGEYDIELPAGRYRINYIIVEKGREPRQAPEEQKSQTFELTKDQRLDIDVK